MKIDYIKQSGVIEIEIDISKYEIEALNKTKEGRKLIEVIDKILEDNE